MEAMESLSDFTDAYESVLRACEELEAYYENIKDSGKLGSRKNCDRISERREQIIS